MPNKTPIRFDQGGSKYVAAQHADFSIAAPSGLISGAASAPARLGETIIRYGTGFGPTNPLTPAGQVVAAPAEIDKSQLRVLIGGTPRRWTSPARNRKATPLLPSAAGNGPYVRVPPAGRTGAQWLQGVK